MKKNILRIVKLVCYLPKILGNYFYDASRFVRYSSILGAYQNKNIESLIAAHCHSIERGFSLPDTREGFGVELRKSLFQLLYKYINEYEDLDQTLISWAVNILDYYVEWHKESNVELGEFAYDVTALKNALKTKGIFTSPIKGGVFDVVKDDLVQFSVAPFRELAAHRHSIRNYSEQEVDIALLEEAVRIAQSSPSVCNRQSAKVYIIKDKLLLKDALQLQNGNRGFTKKINSLLIVTTDMRSFFGVNERYQAYIDGGLFSMSLLYALQYLGLGACSLNWSVEKQTDISLKKKINISNSENVIMFVSVGHLPDELSVACSAKKNIHNVIIKKM